MEQHKHCKWCEASMHIALRQPSILMAFNILNWLRQTRNQHDAGRRSVWINQKKHWGIRNKVREIIQRFISLKELLHVLTSIHIMKEKQMNMNHAGMHGGVRKPLGESQYIQRWKESVTLVSKWEGFPAMLFRMREVSLSRYESFVQREETQESLVLWLINMNDCS